MPCSDDLDRAVRRLEAERYRGDWWRRRVNTAHLSNSYAGDDAIAELNAEIAESDRTDRKATEARREAKRQARIDEWKAKRAKESA